jgi:hypothetical protein
MVPSPFIVVLDANVFFPFTLRDTLLRAAAAGFYQVRWSSQILDEMTRNLIAKGTMPEASARRLRTVMEREFPEAEVKGYEHLQPQRLPMASKLSRLTNSFATCSISIPRTSSSCSAIRQRIS